MKTAHIIACDLTTTSKGLTIALRCSYPSSSSAAMVNRTVYLKTDIFGKLTEFFMGYEENPPKISRGETKEDVIIRKAVSLIRSWNMEQTVLSITTLAGVAFALYNYFQEHGFLPVPLETPRKNAKAPKNKHDTPLTREEMMEALNLVDFRVMKKIESAPIIDPLAIDPAIYGEEKDVKRITPEEMEEWLASSASQTKTTEELEAEAMKELETMDKLLSNL